MTENYPLGTRFIPQGRKRKDIYTITDIHKTYNNAGELVKIRYVATTNFMGQTLTDYDVIATTIARGIIND